MNNKYALLSLTDKSNLAILISSLVNHNFKLIGTTSTAKTIKDLGYECQLVEEITNFPEILEGRVKTLQPQIHGGILADLSKENQLADLEKHQINPISVVVCNLYPFEEVLEKETKRHQEVVTSKNSEAIEKSEQQLASTMVENIDIGGVTLIRAASKNYQHVTILCDPQDYNTYIEHLNNNQVSNDYRKSLAMKGFIHTANYDSMIANYFMETEAKQTETLSQLLISAPLKQKLRYGENPHQKAYYFEKNKTTSYSMSSSQVIQGKELSYNNLLDIDAAYNAIYEFDQPCALAFKHNTPCGIGFAEDILKAYLKCYEVDPVSIFGGVVIFNQPVDLQLAQKLNEIFLEIIIAPDFSKEALQEFSNKKNLRVIKGNFDKKQYHGEQIRSINGGYLLQDSLSTSLAFDVVTTTGIDNKVKEQLLNLYKVVKSVKSNAVIYGQGQEVLGISGGMVSRIDACEFGMQKVIKHPAYQNNEPLLLASDAYFPFNDIVELAVQNKIKYIIQPGGSINDEKLIAACNEKGIAMAFTGKRYFKH